MSQRDEALGSVLEAARALQRDGVSGPGLAALFEAVDGVEAVRDAESRNPMAGVGVSTVTLPVSAHPTPNPFKPATPRVMSDRDRDGLCQGDPECFRLADLPSGTCYAHSPHGQAPLPFERARRRDPALGGGADG
jgi:hypothetical protein